MIVIYLTLLVAVILINRYLFGSAIKPTDIFSIIWCVFAGLASLGVMGFYQTGILTNVLIIVTIISFNVAYIVGYCIKNKSKNLSISAIQSNKSDKEEIKGLASRAMLLNKNVNTNVIIIVNVICWVFSIPYLMNSMRILFTEGFEAIRMYTYTYGEEAMVASTNAQLLFTWVVQPVFIATMAIAVASLTLSLENRFVFLGISVVDILLYTLLFGGRGTMLKFLSYLAIVIIIVSGKQLMRFIIKNKGLIFLIMLGIVAILWMISLRSIHGVSVFKNIYAYVAGPFIFLDKILEEYPVGTLRLWGTATIGCIVSVVGIVGKVLFSIDFTAPENSIPSLTSGYLDIAPDVKFNSMTTMIYPFLLDYGYFGAFVGPVIYGAFVAFIERMFRKERSLRSLCIFIHVFHTVIFSMQNYVFFKFETLSIIIFIILFTTTIRFENGKIILT